MRALLGFHTETQEGRGTCGVAVVLSEGVKEGLHRREGFWVPGLLVARRKSVNLRSSAADEATSKHCCDFCEVDQNLGFNQAVIAQLSRWGTLSTLTLPIRVF